MQGFLCPALALMVAALSVSSCKSGGSPPTDGGNAAVTIRMIPQGTGIFAFTPNPASAAGRTVQFKNDTNETHRVRLNDLSIDFGDIAPGATSATRTMPAAGANYHCSNHPGMIGQVFAPGDVAPPPCEGIYCTGY
jgi:plastocyanin